jgi:hypothetical protein
MTAAANVGYRHGIREHAWHNPTFDARWGDAAAI